MSVFYRIRIKRGCRYQDMMRGAFPSDVDALDWFNALPMQKAPILLRAPGGRIIAKRPANT